MTVIVYLRVSTEEQNRRGYSIPEQREACRARARALAEPLGLEPQIFEFVDTVGGDWLERPALDQVREFLRQHRADYFVCLDPDRFSRKLVNQLLIAEEIERTGCRLEFVQHEYRPDPEGQAFFAVRGIFSQLEKAKILERTSRGKRGKIAAGGIPHAFLAYGYRWIHKAPKGTSPLEPDPETAPWVQRIYQWCIEGLTAQEIARRLTSLGAVPPRRRRMEWNRSTVAGILRNPVYRGEAIVNRLDAAGIQSIRQFPPEWRRKRGLKLTFRLRPPEQWRSVRVPAIVDPETWDRAQKALARHAKVRYKGTGRWLRGLGRCGICGSLLYYGTRGSGNRQYMACSARFRKGAEKCTLPHKLTTWVEEAVWEEIRRWISDPQLIDQAIRTTTRDQPEELERVQAELRDAKQKLAGKEAEIRRVGLLFARGLWDQEVTESALRALRLERDELQQWISDLETRHRHLQVQENVPWSLEHLRKLRQELMNRLDHAGPEEKREIALSLMDFFVLHPTPPMQKAKVTVVPRVG